MDENIRTLVRGLEVLKHLNRMGPGTGQSISAALSLSRPTTYRILGTFERCGLVSRDEGGVYRLARGVKGLSRGFTNESWALWIATPILYELQEKILWPTDLAVLEDGEMVIRETTHGVSPYSIETGMVGSRHSLLRSSFGRAYLAFCPEQERQALLQRSQRGLAQSPVSIIEQMDRTIRETRTCGYAIRQREVHLKTSSIAVPLRYGDRVLACLNVVWIASAIEFNRAVQQCYPALAHAQERIEREFMRQGSGILPQPTGWRPARAAA